MKARHPDESGVVDRDGVRIHWDRYGDGDVTVLLLPTWSVVDSRIWKFQVPYLARHARVLTFDGRGCGNSDRPTDPAAYAPGEFAADAVAVLDASETGRAIVVGLSFGAAVGLVLAATQPDRIAGLVAIGPGLALAPGHPERDVPFDVPLDRTDGWAKNNIWYWRRGPDEYGDFLEFFFGEMFCEPHSTKHNDDCVGWGQEIDIETLIAASTWPHPGVSSADLCDSLRCPVLVIHGDEDRIVPHAVGARMAELTGGELVAMVGSGHGPMTRDPVFVNGLISNFALTAGAERSR